MLPGKPSNPSDMPGGRVTHVSFGVSGITLDPEEVLRRTGITPHRWYRCGDQYVGRGRDRNPTTGTRPHGAWAIDSTKLVNEKRPEEHVRAVLELVHPKSAVFAQLADEGFTPMFWITHAREEGELGYSIRADDVRRIADLRADLSIVCNVLPFDGDSITRD